ncbi:inhibitor of apoptosis-promoting Bax1 protein [Rhizoctonia solani]|uniref:Inhibitor of apoptosis-promoting Bax1 protein n=1 Tax=Rhizoctonia solani TaxID=456999 RepID=A0A8H8P065_9AGAM|nr:inhibitor of apoptosis-promoting Bax1 protein [Rhizoctonia solani]QRW21473.1 inhibitor of apoptosis-promoting Bax1 protein [Rhizoctonia solani]
MSNYPQAPPSYQPVPQSPQKYNQYGSAQASEPLLGETRGQSSRGVDAFGDDNDLPDDFKYGVTVSESAPEIRRAFVYSILFAQILGTCVVTKLASSDSAIAWVQTHQWAVFVPLFGSLINLGLLWWKRLSYPTNYILLTSFTVLESLSLGLIVSYYESTIVLQAMLITLGVFLGLTLFTLQSKYDFSGMGPFLFGGLLVLVMTGFVGMFVPFSHTMDLIYAAGGCLIFSGYIVFDASVSGTLPDICLTPPR